MVLVDEKKMYNVLEIRGRGSSLESQSITTLAFGLIFSTTKNTLEKYKNLDRIKI